MTPAEFFDVDSPDPSKLQAVTENLKHLNARQFEAVSVMIEELARK